MMSALPLSRPARVTRWLRRSLLPLAIVSAGWAAEPLASFVPAEVGLYIEGQHIDDLLLPLTEPQAWLTLAELGGQRAGIEEAADWQNRIRQTIRMEPAEALRLLLSDQFAYLAEGPGRAQDAVVLCRPTVEIDSLLERWQAQPLPTAGRSSLYRLPNRVGLALPDGLLMFGDEAPIDGMFQRVLRFADSPRQGSLADDAVFRGLLARVPERPDAVLFARLQRDRPTSHLATARESAPASGPATTAPAAQPVPGELPGPLRGAAHVLLALHRRDSRLHITAVGDGPAGESRENGKVKAIVERLPERTLLAWGLMLDYPGLLRHVESLPEQSLVRNILRFQQGAGIVQRLVAALDPATCLALGVVEPQTRTLAAPPIPAAAVLVATRQPHVVAEALETSISATASSYNMLVALKTGSPPLPPVERVPVEHGEAWLLNLSELLRQYPSGASLTELHLCWAVDADVLIVASHLDWLRQILAARHHESATLSGILALSGRPIAPNADIVTAVQPGPIADLGRLWLAHLEQTAPYVLDENWWRQRQPGGGDVRLGIQVTEIPDQKRLRVTSIERGAPAEGVLKPGDEIVGCSGRRFSTTQPLREIRAAIAQRPYARWVDLELERAGSSGRAEMISALLGRVPLPFADPVQVLRRAIAIGQIVQRLVYHDDVPDAGGARGFLTIELRRSQAPLFPFQVSQPVQVIGEKAEPTP